MFNNIFSKLKKKAPMPISLNIPSSPITPITTAAKIVNYTGTATIPYNINPTTFAPYTFGTITSNKTSSRNTALTISGNNGKELVTLGNDGKVVWADPLYDVDAAAEAFARCLTYSLEIQAGITKAVKMEIRDSIFQDMINIAKQKGSLSVDDLTYLLEASKIMEKLKGGK